jgi:hypothetical protein
LIVSVGIKLAMFVNGISNLKGKEKSELVISAIVQCLDEIDSKTSKGPEDKLRYEHLKDTAKTAVPSAIQAVIDVSNGKFSIKKVKPSMILSMFSCFASTAVSVAALSGVITKDQATAADSALDKVEGIEKAVVAAEAAVAAVAEEPAVAAVAAAPAAVALETVSVVLAVDDHEKVVVPERVIETVQEKE